MSVIGRIITKKIEVKTEYSIQKVQPNSSKLYMPCCLEVHEEITIMKQLLPIGFKIHSPTKITENKMKKFT